uniref:Uncharacterized protein n=1 Tax=Parascaris univalens TaxID=6257 RepID=A0A915C7J0_PARUN
MAWVDFVRCGVLIDVTTFGEEPHSTEVVGKTLKAS